jgi:DNA-binding CsgD family transcriptional regulator
VPAVGYDRAVILGRDRERSTLLGLVAVARDGIGASVIVRGAPGIGKTALLDELVAATDATTLYACGHEWEADLPYAALGDLLHPVLDHLDRVPTPQARALRNALGLESSAAIDPIAVEVATATLLRTLAADDCVLVVADDLQWIDTASREVLMYVARRASQMRVAFVGAARDDEMTPALAALPTLEVGPLAATAAEMLLNVRSAGKLAAPVVETLVGLAGGNPLALQELCDGLSAQQLAGQAAIVAPINVSTEAVLAFRRRIDELPETARQALLIAAAEGRGRVDQVVAALARCQLDAGAFDPAEHQGLISIVGDSVQFRHPLVRSVSYQTATPTARRAVHATLADVETDPDRRAWHLSSAVVPPNATACAALVELGTRALARGADITAALALARAAELADASHDRGALYAKAARAANRGGDVPMATRLLDLARPLIADLPVERSDLVLLDADLRMRGGDFELASRGLTQAAEEVAAVDRRRAMTLLLFAAKSHVYKMEGAAALRAVERALELSDGPAVDMLQLSALAMTQTMAGDPHATATALTAAHEGIASRRGHLHTLGIAWPLIWLEQYDAAREFVTWAVHVQREGGYHSFLPQSLLPEAELDFRTGHWDRALAGASEAAQLYEETGQSVDGAIAASTLARIEAARGNGSACVQHAGKALDGDRASGLRAATAFAEAGVGHLELARQRFDQAIEHLSKAAAIAVDGGVLEPGLLQLHPDLVESLVRSGREPEARVVAGELAERATGSDRPGLLAAALRCRGLLSPEPDAQDALAEALTLLDRTPFERARTELCIGMRLRGVGMVDDGRRHLTVALDLFASLGARLWLDLTRAELRAIGAPLIAPDRLTPREEQVARLVAGGASNRDVADSLYVNPKTVEYHLVNVYRKLGVKTRTELALVWRDDPAVT